MGHTRFADWVRIWVVHLPELTGTGGPNYLAALAGYLIQTQFYQPLIQLPGFDLFHAYSKLDYQVSICSLIAPATAISKTQNRADTSVWWKLPFSIFNFLHNLLCSKRNN